MLAVKGVLRSCGGIVLFYVLLHLRRRDQFVRLLRSRAIGELSIFAAMSISLYGIAMLGRFGAQLAIQSYGMQETLMIGAIMIVLALSTWKLYIPLMGAL